MPYSTVLFDLDHTLVDSDRSEASAFAHTMRLAGVTDHQPLFDTYRRINLAMWARVEAGTMLANDVRTKRFESFNRATGIDADPVAMGEAFVEGLGGFGGLYPGAIELLEAVDAIAALGLVTNGISEVQRARIARLDIERFFDAVVISSEVATSKPGGAIFDIAFERLGRPDRTSTVMVGDSLTSDMAGGHGYGIATCWYNPRGEPPVVDFELDHVVTELADVLGVVT